MYKIILYQILYFLRNFSNCLCIIILIMSSMNKMFFQYNYYVFSLNEWEIFSSFRNKIIFNPIFNFSVIIFILFFNIWKFCYHFVPTWTLFEINYICYSKFYIIYIYFNFYLYKLFSQCNLYQIKALFQFLITVTYMFINVHKKNDNKQLHLYDKPLHSILSSQIP